MKSKLSRRSLWLPLLLALIYSAFGSAGTLFAAVAQVNIVDFAFSPASTTINVNDQVTWTWMGSAPHSTTSDSGLWDSGINSTGFTFTQTFDNAGNFPYHCTVHSFMTAAITVHGATNMSPTITTQPKNQTISAGHDASFTVSASGSAPLFYQWSFAGTAIPDATNSSLTIHDAQAVNAGSYAALVTNLFGTVMSSNALLIVSGATAPLVVQVNGSGTVSPDYNGKSLVLGKPYTMTARPSTGSVFSNWSGSAESTLATLTFVMQPGLVFQANFVPSPFGQNPATFNGLFFDTNAISQQSSGNFTLTLTPAGKYTAKLQSGSARFSLRGQFNATGSASNLVLRSMRSSLTVMLQLEMPDLERVTGTVSDGSFTVGLSGDRATFDGHQSIAPQAGQYTMVISGADGTNSLPGGDSIGTLTVDKAGRIRMAGLLADGTKISQSATLARNGNWPFYVPLYGGSGSTIGWLTFATTPTNDLAGELFWLKPNLPTARFYPDGFSFATMAAGLRYEQPPSGSNVLSFSAGTATFSGGGLAQDITEPITLGTNNRVTDSGTNRLTLTFIPSTGFFKGRVANPDITKAYSTYGGGYGGGGSTPPTIQWLPFSGVVFQDIGIGYFLGTNQSGSVLVAP